MNLLFIDFETRSEIDLTKLNAWIYSEDPQADIICMAYALNNEPVKTWEPGQTLPEEFKKVDFIIAHSVLFEHAIINNIGIKKYNFPVDMANINKYICTAGMARSAGLPGSLEKCGQALNISHKKLDQGKKLIQKYCKPKRKRGSDTLYFLELEGQDKKEMFTYCMQDVEAEREIFNILKDLSNNKLERDIFLLDFKQNIKGLNVNIEKTSKILDFINLKNAEIEKEIEKRYPGLNIGSTKQFKEKIIELGYYIENTQEDTLLELYNKANDEVQDLIDSRLFLAKASIKKFQALKDLTSPDGKTRHFLQYYGAGTGRWAGRGFQPHNLPKAKTKRIVDLIDLNSMNKVDIIDNLKKLLPTMILPEEKCKFISGDFSAIEARVLAYLAKEEKILDVYEKKQDLYIKMASKVFHVSEERVTKEQRQLGKGIILGCGYGMGASKFYSICVMNGLNISMGLAEESVKLYRDMYGKIPKFWYDLEEGFRKALQGDTIKVGLITIEKIKNYIAVALPNGRILYYHKIRLNKGTLEYWNHSRGYYVSLWGGILTENVVQAVSRDILADRMLVLERKKIHPVLHVHDEIVCEVEEDKANDCQIEFDKIVNTPPEWLPNFPLVTESVIEDYYIK